MATICVAGIWHQGAVVAACLAELGHAVHGVADEASVASLSEGRPLVFEPGLTGLLARNLEAGRLRFTTVMADALRAAEFVYLSLDTPVSDEDIPNVAPVYDVARRIGDARSGDITLVVTAQVPVGTTERLARTVAERSPMYRCDVVYVPEFLRLGTAVGLFFRPDRVVIGGDDPGTIDRVASLYTLLDRPIVRTSIRNAEMAKHASNAYLATSISFANEIADLCESAGADARTIEQILKLDQRIGPYAFLSPGLGFAGGTLGREVRTLQQIGSEHHIETTMLDAVWQVNAQRPALVRRRLAQKLGSLANQQIGVLGLTYKAGTSTLRRAIAVDVVRDLVAHGAQVVAFDPLANYAEVSNLPPMRIVGDPYSAAVNSDALVLLTEWEGIADVDLEVLRGRMRGRLFLDTRNLLDSMKMHAAGFEYLSIGGGDGRHDDSAT